METQPIVVKQERIDDIPLLLGMMRRMKIAEIVDKHLGEHHLHQQQFPLPRKRRKIRGWTVSGFANGCA
jgi:hypothetical protein